MLAARLSASPRVFVRHLSLAPSLTGLRLGADRAQSLAERRGRLSAYIAAWRALAWRRALRVPFPPADSAQIRATRLPSPLRAVARQDVVRHLPSEVRAWALDTAQDLLVFVENNDDGPSYPVHCISMKTGRRHARAAILPSLDDDFDPWFESSEDMVRIHNLLAGVVHAGRLRIYQWRTGHLLLDVPCADDFTFLDDAHVLLTAYDPDTLQPSILLYPLSLSKPLDAPPMHRFHLPRLRPTLGAAAEVFVRLAADSPPPTSRLGAFYADSTPAHRALFVRLEVFALSGPGGGSGESDHSSTLCVPLRFFQDVVYGKTPFKETDSDGAVSWRAWGPQTCGAVPRADKAHEPGVFGFRAARVVVARNDADALFEVYDFHPGRVALARAALEEARAALEWIPPGELTFNPDDMVDATEVLVADGADGGTWSICASSNLDARVWDASSASVTESDLPGTEDDPALKLQMPYIVSRRRIPREHVELGQGGGGRALLTEDALLYVPVRDFVTGEPSDYAAFVF